jgi:small subunit ribosomal protein S20
MANSKSAAKRARQTTERSLRNRRVLTHLRNLNKRTRSAEGVDAGKLPGLVSAIDKAAKRGVIHRNAANRRKARLARALAAGKK